MKVYDCFIFNDEFELLDLRIRELDSVVDVFVLCESDHTFRGERKPMYYLESGTTHPKIRHVPYKAKPVPHPGVEWNQRRALYQGLHDADMMDLVLLGDVDEMPSRGQIEKFRRCSPGQPVACKQLLYYYWINCCSTMLWNGTIALPRGVGEIDMQEIRELRNRLPYVISGWHFSWMGGLDGVRHKLATLDVASDVKIYGGGIEEPDLETAEERVEAAKDLFGREVQLAFTSILPGKTHPTDIVSWIEDHPDFYREPAPQIHIPKPGARKIPRRAVFYWGEQDISPLRKAAFETFRRHHPSWEMTLIVPEEVLPIRMDCLSLDVDLHRVPRIVPGSVQDSDLQRYLYLSKRGGVYLDTDMLFLRPLDPLIEDMEAKGCDTGLSWSLMDALFEKSPNRSGWFNSICCLVSAGQNQFWRDVYTFAKECNSDDPQRHGIKALSEMVHDWEDLSSWPHGFYNIRKSLVCPMPYDGIQYLWTSSPYMCNLENAYALHWYGGDPGSAKFESTCEPGDRCLVSRTWRDQLR